MINASKDYSLFHKFIKTYAPVGFLGIDRNDSLILELEEMTKANKQFFHVADLIQAKIIWASKRSSQMLGIDPEEINAYHFIEASHPEDLEKHILGRSKMWCIGHEIYKNENGKSLLSIDLRMRNHKGEYPNLLVQLYFFYSAFPYKSAFMISVVTDIDSFKRRKQGYHYYVGDDLSYFRYPDQELLMTGNPLSNREFEIVKLIKAGLSTELIAKQLFLSLNTVNTHRSNILKKTGFNTISGLIIDYQKRGLL